MRRKPYWLVLVLIVAISPLLALPVGADTPAPASPGSFLTGPNEGDPVDIATDYFRENAADYGLAAADVADLAVRSVVPSQHTGASHVNINQRSEGLEVFGADTTVTLAADGSVAFVGGASVGNLAVAAGTDVDLDAAAAVAAAADALDLDEPQDLRTMRRAGGAARETVLTDGGISDEPIQARLGWQPTRDGLRLAWQVVIDDASDVNLWNATVDAATGDLLDLDDWTSDSNYDRLESFLDARRGQASTNSFAARMSAAAEARTDVGPVNPVDDGSSYRVLQIPMDSPLDGDPVLVTNPAEATASPFGWHDVSGTSEPDFTITRGNNVHAYFDQDANNQPDPGFDVDGGPGLAFDFEIEDVTEHPQNYREADITNLFYWCNVVHDVLYGYGFDEPSGNFQVNNYGRGGVGGDDVRCEAQDGGGTNNANFSTPAADGGRPRMQMFLWPGTRAGSNFGPQNQVVVDDVGEFGGSFARFSAAPTSAGTSGEIVNAGNGCNAAQYPGTLPSGDWIALVTTGTCTNPTKGQVAQALGASALIVSGGGTAGILTGTITLPRVDIPVMSLNTADGNTIRAALPASGTVRKHPNHPGIRTGDLDNAIIIHEYGHGISLRLTGGPGINCLSGQEQMGEGWSDYYGIAMLIDPKLDDPDFSRGLVPYVLFEPERSSPGLRPRPYSRDKVIQPFTYDSIKTGGWLNGGSLSQPHGIGHGWANTTLTMTWDLIDKHGFNPNLYEPWDTGGNNLAMQLVTDGLKIQGCGPGFVVGRNAILTADQLLTGGENQCTIWASFARDGLGFSAVQGTTNRNDNDEAFDTHPDCREGFRQPIRSGDGQLNVVAAGSTVPLRFDLGSNQGLDILASNSPFSRRVDCETFAVPSEDPPNITPRAPALNTSPPGKAGLSVSRQGVYLQNWQTEEAWAGTCRELVLTRLDGVQHRAFFEFVEAD